MRSSGAAGDRTAPLTTLKDVRTLLSLTFRYSDSSVMCSGLVSATVPMQLATPSIWPCLSMTV